MLGGQPVRQVFGIEIDADVCARTSEKLHTEFGVRKRNFLLSDFFQVDRETVGQVNAIIGNPPFIRYHRFAGRARNVALARAADLGVHLSKLTSSWAPFLIHSAAMLEHGGRLAMVVPMEIGHAAYALPVLEYLAKSFGRATFLTFRKKLFPDLSENTLLLLAEAKGARFSGFFWRDLHDAGSLSDLQKTGKRQPVGTRRIDAEAVCRGSERLIEYFVPRKARELYRELKQSCSTRRLGELVDVGIGYVTGANDFFHLAPTEVKRWQIPKAFLRPAVRRSRSLAGLRFTRKDWLDAVKAGEAGFLLLIDADESTMPQSVRRYLEYGEAEGVSERYKCRTRSPWFSVRHVHKPDAFLSYMSGLLPRLVANDAGVVAPNSLHILRIHPHISLTSRAIAALWRTSLTSLSVEIEGHALGGGMLKLEPSEAENVLVPTDQVNNGELESFAQELGALVRSGDLDAARSLADKALLIDRLGLTHSDCRLLRTAAEKLRNRRLFKDEKA